MKKNSVIDLSSRVPTEKSVLEEIVRAGAREMLHRALQEEVTEFLKQFSNMVDVKGNRLLVRNGYLPERKLSTGIGEILIHQPRVRDKTGQAKFTSKILPPFARRTPSIDALIPVLYLKGISTGDFSEALKAILGEHAAGLSATNIVRLKEGWQEEYDAWSKRDLTGKRYVYFWADGLYFNVRLEADRPCFLVVMGATEDGRKELVGLLDGERESKISWQTLLRDLKLRGLRDGPKLAVGDGALGFWAALAEEFPNTEEQRCWVHKTANILDKMPRSIQPDAKRLIHDMYMAQTLADAKKVYVEFIKRYQAKYPKAVDCLIKDERELFAFYSYPADHWVHLRTTNPIESAFATVRHRTRQTKGCGSRQATTTMVFKLGLEAEKTWRRLNGHKLIAKVIDGVKFVDGEIQQLAA